MPIARTRAQARAIIRATGAKFVLFPTPIGFLVMDAERI